MNKATGFSVITTGEGKRITVKYSTLDDTGAIKNTNQNVNYVALSESLLSAIAVIEADAENRLNTSGE